MKKISIAILMAMLLVPQVQTVSAEEFTYTFEVVQPTLAVSITNNTNENVYTIEGGETFLNVDSYNISNTGTIPAVINAKGTLTRTDGGDVLAFASSFTPALVNEVSATLNNKEIGNAYINETTTQLLEVDPGISKAASLYVKVHPELTASFVLKVQYTAVAK